MKNRIRIETIKKPKGRSDILYTLKKTGGDALAHVLLTHLEWDSRIFGFKIGRLAHAVTCLNDSERSSLFGKLLRDCERRGYHHLHCRADPQDIDLLRCLEDIGFRIADIQITLATKLRFRGIAQTPPKRHVFIRKAVLADMKELRGLVKGAFTHTRFTLDRRYHRADVDRMYYEWIKNSLKNALQSVFVACDRRSREIAGFIIAASGKGAGPQYNIGYIDLVAVKGSFQGRGIGTSLSSHAVGWFKTVSDLAEVRTQISNYAAMAAFMKSGFTEFTAGKALPAGISLHYWFDNRRNR